MIKSIFIFFLFFTLMGCASSNSNMRQPQNVNFPFGETEVDSSGKQLLLSYKDALAHCEGKGMRLPFVREYAEYSYKLGGADLINSQYPQKNFDRGKDLIDEMAEKEYIEMTDRQYTAVFHLNSQGHRAIDFYVGSSSNYKPIDSKFEKRSYWAVAPSALGDGNPVGNAYSFREDNGYVYFISGKAPFKLAVRCIK